MKSVLKSALSRRELLRLAAAVGSAAALTSMLEGCAPADLQEQLPPSPTSTREAPTSIPQPVSTETSTTGDLQPVNSSPVPSVTPTETTSPSTTRLAFVKTSDRAQGVRQAVELLGINPVEGKTVFLKPNFNSADPTPGSTHPDVLSTLVILLKEMGAQTITVGDRSGMGETRRVMDELGVFRLAEEFGFDTLVFDELTAEDWVMIPSSGSHWKEGFAIARACLDAGALVQTCCLKTHRFGGHFTLSLKNSVGIVAKRVPQIAHDFMSELHSSPHQRRMIAEINAAYTPALIVLDGVEAFISGGPDAGDRVNPQVILASTDRIAIDVVGIALLRHFGCRTEAGQGKIFEQEQIARAVELGLGVDSPEKIEFLTPDPESAAYAKQIQAVLLAG